jgi:hypothetical protein
MTALLSIHSRGFEVALTQARLNARKASPMPLAVDGIFGPLTRSAVVSFQLRNGLAADGMVGPKTDAELARGSTVTGRSHGLGPIAQPTPTTCWAASTAMMTRTSVAAVVARTPKDMIAADGGLLNSSESDQAVVTGQRYGSVHGLRCRAPMSYAPSAMAAMVDHSPLMFDMLWNANEYAKGHASPGHMVAISAMVHDAASGAAGPWLLVLDPWPPNVGKVHWVEYGAWMRQVLTRTYRVFERA